MYDSALNANHAFVREKIAAGEIADFTARAGYDSENKPAVDAVFLRRLMLGLEDGARVLLPGVRIRGARVAGMLDLSDCAGAGGAGLPALALESCDLPDRIDVSGTRLARLSIDGSRFREFLGSGVRIDGNFDFNGAVPLPAESGDASAVLHMPAARIGGDVWGARAQLKSPGDPGGPRPDALFLQSAEISGDLQLRDGFSAEGEVSLSGAKIGGDLDCHGGRFANPGAAALVATRTQVGGAVFLCIGFAAEGSVSLLGSKIVGNLTCDEGRFANPAGMALNAEGIEIGGAALLRTGFEAEGLVWLLGAKIVGNLGCEGGRISGLGGRAMVAAGAEIGGAVLLCNGFAAQGEVSLHAAKVGGNLACERAKFVNAGETAINAEGVEIGGAALMRNSFEAEGEVWFLGAKIAGNLVCSEGRIANPGKSALVATGADIGGAVFLDDGFIAEGRVALRSARIGGNLELSQATLKNAGGYAFILDNARIEGDLSAANNTFEGAASLAGARIGRMLDDPDTAWKGAILIDLNELSYAHLGAHESAKPPLWKGRMRWLERNSVKKFRRAFSNQPWSECAAAFARAGRMKDARRIAREEQRAANRHREPWLRPFYWLFAELPFGYGLSVTRATVTCIAFWVAGWAGTEIMLARGALVDAQQNDRACTSVTAPLYALDTAIPLLDFAQEGECKPGRANEQSVRETPATPLGALLDNVEFWRWAKTLYALFGAIVVGFAILTYTGIFKPKAQS